MESIDHFSHQHPLDPCKLSGEEKVKCSACEQLCMEHSYGCSECRFFLHKRCAELPRERNHPLHPPHSLKLSDTANYLGLIYCDACEKKSRGFTFRCDECDFDLDIGCALKAESEGKKSFGHFSHEHALTLEEGDIAQEVWCRACEKRCSSPAYVCKECGYFLHKACGELPQELNHHLHSDHPLKLQTTAYDGQVWCNYCEKKVLGFTYHCQQCDFDLDVECAQIYVVVDPKQIKHFSHRHALVLSEKKEEDEVLCVLCQKSCTGDAFGCELCEFFLHRSCADLPEEMDNPFHEGHPLKLHILLNNFCDNCDLRIRGYAYRCDQCDFDLDIKCAQKLASNPELGNVHEKKKKDTDNEEIQHFAHEQHMLKCSSKMDEKRYRCMACDKLCSGVVYSCDKCEFFLHQSCAELPRQLKHYFHEHELTLQSNGLEDRSQQEKDGPKMACRACQKRCRGFTYSCSQCRFDMDVECTLMAQRKRAPRYSQHFCHGHPLKLIKKDMPELCSACTKQGSKHMYGCNKCRMWLDKSCKVDLSEMINHFFHPHKLKLNTLIRNVKCKACRKECQGFTFNCEECVAFNLDVACALMPLRMSEGHAFLGHGHPLKLIEIHGETGIHCSVCEKRCRGPTYKCGICNFYVHKDCGELQKNITHDFHPIPNHPLELKIKDRFKCQACLKESSGFTYNCVLCSQFSLHVGCRNLKPVIKYGGHHHPLAFFRSVYEKEALLCNGNECKSKILSSIRKQQGVVRCVECSTYNLHLLCGPLPCTINSKKHKHPLTLEDKFIEEWSDESYCDACEKERDPSMCVYKCEHCPYVAAFDCMESEVIELLQGKENHVKLRSLHRGVPGEVITEGIEATEMVQEKRAEGDGQAIDVERVDIENVVSLDNLLDSFIRDEDMNLTENVEFLKKEMADLQDQISCIVPNVSSYPYRALKELMARLETSVREVEFSMIFFGKEEIVNVEEFMTIKSLVPTLKQILLRHNDIVSRSGQPSQSKSFVFTMLCGAIRSMLKLDGQIQSVSEMLLFNWWNHFMLAYCAGFDVQFLMSHLKRITLAYFALKAKEVQEGKLDELAGKIGESEKFFSNEEANLESISKEEELILANSAESGLFEDPTVEPAGLEKKVLGVVVNDV